MRKAAQQQMEQPVHDIAVAWSLASQLANGCEKTSEAAFSAGATSVAMKRYR